MSFAHACGLSTGSTLSPRILQLRFANSRLQPGHVAEFGRADRREILRVREQDRPAVADPVVEVDRPLGRLGREIRRLVIDAQ